MSQSVSTVAADIDGDRKIHRSAAGAARELTVMCTSHPCRYRQSSLPPYTNTSSHLILTDFLTLHCTALHYITLHSTTPHCTISHCISPHCTALRCTISHCIAPHRTALYHTAYHHTALRCAILHCIAPHRTVRYGVYRTYRTAHPTLRSQVTH